MGARSGTPRPLPRSPRSRGPPPRRPWQRADRLTLAIVVLCLLGHRRRRLPDLRPLRRAEGALPGQSAGCKTVQASQWSKLAGIPVCVLGLIG